VTNVPVMPVEWSDEVDEILASDLAAALAYLTPAKGVLISPMAPLGIRDRERGTVTLSSSLGLWRKLERIRRDPAVAVAYHARDHGLSDRPGFVLVQGRASFGKPDREWLESITPEWDRFLVPKKGGLVGRALDVYYWQRVRITIEIERVVAYPDDAASGEPTITGSARPDPPRPQPEPKKGTGPRVDTAKVAGDVGRLPHTLLGWQGSDGFPEVVPVGGASASESELRLEVPAGSVPPGGRRAGLTAHRFWPRMVGQEQRIHTGWLSAEGETVSYAPHTRTGYRMPPSSLAYHLGCALLATRIRGARAAGLA
jgi:hypothetical protein